MNISQFSIFNYCFIKQSYCCNYTQQLIQKLFRQMGNTCCQQAEQHKGVLVGRVTLTSHYEPSQWPENDQKLQKILISRQLTQTKPFKRSDSQVYYSGQMHHDQPDGKGILYCPNKIFYEGQFSDGYPEGQGKIQFYNKNYTYQGAFKKGEAQGEGIFRNFEQNYSFKGQWVRSLPQKGFIKFDNNSTQIQIQDTIENTVTIHYQDGKVYTGQINQKNFLPQGVGSVFYPDEKRTYTGQWLNGLMHGKGVYQWKNGHITISKYDGDYRVGKKQGYGKFQFQSGNIYEGNFCNGKRNGFGHLCDKNGNIIAKGQWKDDDLIVSTLNNQNEVHNGYGSGQGNVYYIEKQQEKLQNGNKSSFFKSNAQEQYAININNNHSAEKHHNLEDDYSPIQKVDTFGNH